jgi:hypothetical protein
MCVVDFRIITNCSEFGEDNKSHAQVMTKLQIPIEVSTSGEVDLRPLFYHGDSYSING